MERSAIATQIEKQIWQTLTDGSPVVVTSHERLDGDGIGAALGLWHGLRDAGVSCTQSFDSPVPEVFRFLPGLEEQRSPEQLPDRFHLAVVDCGSLDRVGPPAEHADRAIRTLNIDHHVTNDQFGDVNYVDREASSCGELVYRILQAGGVTLTPQIGECLYTAIVTDTGSFSYGNTTREAFEICARLVEAGARPWELCERIFFSPPENVVRLKGEAIDSLRLDADGRLGTVAISNEMFRRTGTRSVDTQGFADIPISVRGVEASALLKEICADSRPSYVKVSLRSRPGPDSVDVCAVAESFGGGGHRHAAGFEFEGALQEARRVVTDVLTRELDG